MGQSVETEGQGRVRIGRWVFEEIGGGGRRGNVGREA